MYSSAILLFALPPRGTLIPRAEALVTLLKIDPNQDLTDAEYLRLCVFLRSGVELPLHDPRILAAIARLQKPIAIAQVTTTLSRSRLYGGDRALGDGRGNLSKI